MRSIIGAKFGGQERLGAGCGWGGVWSETRELGVYGVGWGVRLGSKCGSGGVKYRCCSGYKVSCWL